MLFLHQLFNGICYCKIDLSIHEQMEKSSVYYFFYEGYSGFFAMLYWMDDLQKKIGGAALLVAGTSIGAGMLALPVATSASGFFPALCVYFLCWGFMTMTGYFIAELALKMPEGSNLISMARCYLGPAGAFISWALYLFLFYALSTAYISLGGSLTAGILQQKIGIGSLLFLVGFGSAVFWGTKFVDRLNFWLMCGLVGSYLIFLVFGLSRIDYTFLLRADFSRAFAVFPIIFTAFSYQGTVPSLVSYLDRNPQAIRKAIFLGTSAVFIVYVLWELLILGMIPYEGVGGLRDAMQAKKSAQAPLKEMYSTGLLFMAVEGFSFFSIATSFLGVTMGVFDFLADGLSIKKEGGGKVALWLLTFLPPMVIASSYPNIFFTALDYAGSFGCAILLGFLPILMVAISRFCRKEKALLYPGFSFPMAALLLLIIGGLIIRQAIGFIQHLYY